MSMDDLISRQAAILHLKKRLIETAINNTGLTAACDDVFADIADNRIETWIAELPSAQPDCKTGRWKKSYADHEAFGVRPFFRYCSECHEATVYPYNFCPNCGAKMEVEHGAYH